MGHLFRYSFVAVVWLVLAPVVLAEAWVGGRGIGNTGAYPATPFPPLPALVWKSSRGAALADRTPSNALYSEKTVIVALGKTLLAVSAETGELRWKQELSGVPVGDLLLLDQQLIVTLATGKVSAYHPADGTVVWEHTFTREVVNGPAITNDVLTFALESGYLAVLARKTGKSVANIDLPGDMDAAPLQIGKSILLLMKNGTMSRIEGSINRWPVSLPKGTIRRNAVTNGQLIMVNTDDTIYALNTMSVTSPFRWTYACPNMVDQPTLDGNTVYLATATGQLRAIEAQTGRNRWGEHGVMLPAPAIASPLVIGDILFVRMRYGMIAALAKDTGALAWLYRLSAPADVTIGAPVVDGNTLYVATSDGTLHALSTDMPDVDPPTFRQVLPTMAGIDFANTRPLEFVGAIVEDDGSGVQPGSVTVSLDGTDLTPKVNHDVTSGYQLVWLRPAVVPQPGMHRLVMSAKDQRGNTGTLTTTFYVGNAATTERVPIVINGEFLPKQLKVRPGTIIEWINNAGSPRTVCADDKTFSSDTQFPNGIPLHERWVWVIPADAPVGKNYYYHCRLRGEAGTGDAMGPGLAGVLEIVDPRRDLPGMPKVTPAMLPTFPSPATDK